MPDQRPSAQARGYGTAWAKARKGYLASHPHCIMCHKQGMVVQATVVDHIKRHGGDQALFWDKANWQPLCKPHHDSTKQMIEGGRIVRLIGSDGWPVDL
jgi:5-methylcytosine-specific restriction protein A